MRSQNGLLSGVRVGVDLCDVAQIAESIEEFGNRYLERIYTPHELSTCLGSPDTHARLGARFAAKEAMIKVLRPTGPRPEWRSIEVRSAVDGSCSIELSGLAKELADHAGISAMALSLTHEGQYAAAVVVAACDDPVPRTATRSGHHKDSSEHAKKAQGTGISRR